MKKTHQVAYLEDLDTVIYIHKNIPPQGKSAFIRAATKKAVELDKAGKNKSTK